MGEASCLSHRKAVHNKIYRFFACDLLSFWFISLISQSQTRLFFPPCAIRLIRTKAKQKMVNAWTGSGANRKNVVQIKEQVKCVDLYFTFRKLLHCITCGCRALFLRLHRPLPCSARSASETKRFVPNEDKYENTDYGPWTISCLKERIYYFHIFENHIVFMHDNWGLLINYEGLWPEHFSLTCHIVSCSLRNFSRNLIFQTNFLVFEPLS